MYYPKITTLLVLLLLLIPSLFGNQLSSVNYNTPAIDLNTSTSGLNNSWTICGQNAYLAQGGTNITSSSGNVDELIISFSTSDIINGNNEMFIIGGAAPFDSVKLGFGSSSSKTFTLNGLVYKAAWSVSNGVGTIQFTNNDGGTLTLVQTELLLDSLKYINSTNNTMSTSGYRYFDVKIREASQTSPDVTLAVLIDCSSILPVSWINFSGKAEDEKIVLDWSTGSEENSKDFLVQHSMDGASWEDIGAVDAAGFSSRVRGYTFEDRSPKSGINYYRLLQRDQDGRKNLSNIISVDYADIATQVLLYPNPASGGVLNVELQQAADVRIFSTVGALIMSQALQEGKQIVDVSQLDKGLYQVVISGKAIPVVIQ